MWSHDMQELIGVISNCFHCRLDELLRPVAKNWQHRENLYVVDALSCLTNTWSSLSD